MQNLNRPLKYILMLFASSIVWLTVFLTNSNHIISSLLPLLHWELTLIAPQYQLNELRVIHQGGESIIKADVTTRHSLQIAGQLVPANTSMSSSTLAGHLLQPLILLLSAITTTCLLHRNKILMILFFTLSAGSLLILLDVPFILVGALDDLLISTISPAQSGHSFWIMWMNFLNAGGRLALAVAAALFVSAVSSASDHESHLIKPQGYKADTAEHGARPI